MTPKEILQKVNDYCNEKSYTEETLTADFKNQFVENFIKGRENEDINDEKVISDLKFNLKTAFSAASKGITLKSNSFTEKENDYKKQIEELQKKAEEKKTEKKKPEEETKTLELPKEIQEQLNELKEFKQKNEMTDKRKTIADSVKSQLNERFYPSFDAFFSKVNVSLEEKNDDVAKKILQDYQEITKGMIGNITPLKPSGGGNETKDIIASVKKIEITN